MKFHFLDNESLCGSHFKKLFKASCSSDYLQTQKLAQAWNLTCWFTGDLGFLKETPTQCPQVIFATASLLVSATPDGIKWYHHPMDALVWDKGPMMPSEVHVLTMLDRAASPWALVRMLLRPTPAWGPQFLLSGCCTWSPGPKQWGSYFLPHRVPQENSSFSFCLHRAQTWGHGAEVRNQNL